VNFQDQRHQKKGTKEKKKNISPLIYLFIYLFYFFLCSKKRKRMTDYKNNITIAKAIEKKKVKKAVGIKALLQVVVTVTPGKGISPPVHP